MKNIQYSTVVWQEGKHFVAQCLNIDISSFGDSRDEALSNLHEALSLYFEDGNLQNYSDVSHPEIHNVSLSYA